MAIQPSIYNQQRRAIPPHTIPGRPKSAFERFVDRGGDFLTDYWAHIVMIGLGILVGTAIAIPFLSYFGLDSIAKPLFFSLHYVCAQIPSHSIYIFGHQLGLCERNFSIYTSMFLTSLVFVLSKKRLPGIPWWLWILMILPMAWDGTTQMFGWRESDWILRVITGTLFGVGNIWFALPLMQKSILETTLPPHLQQPLVQKAPTTTARSPQAPQH
ncbi:hypothetical protein KDA_03280 [Dictyobacter alpinus]|uniref:DUF2085 domain-containing protein n=1 Tax=Dictyobacter alpinus TaxID=2014873 RepID=A0A402B0G7_9CHLR|nr:DUF2085 domain-containing protein [Dictyobacter alpinus]GCE24844.1 hypothetical protein KDA_03280 [Dictyobacter alpinus]